MDKEIAFCGLNCRECQIYTATINDDNTLREKLAAEYFSGSETIAAGDLRCMGCHSAQPLEKMCSDCNMRKCGMEKKYSTCAECESFPCGDVKEYVREESENMKVLLGLREKLHTAK